MIGGNSFDFITGGDGDDTLSGNGGNDVLYGMDGSDQIFGGSGNDYLDAGYYDGGEINQLWGGSGNDVLVSSFFGNDYLYGQGGTDSFGLRWMQYVTPSGYHFIAPWSMNYTWDQVAGENVTRDHAHDLPLIGGLSPRTHGSGLPPCGPGAVKVVELLRRSPDPVSTAEVRPCN